MGVWVGLRIVTGVLLGNSVPGIVHSSASLEAAYVNILVMLFLVAFANGTQGWCNTAYNLRD